MVPFRKTRPRPPRGAVTWVGLVLLAALAGGVYLALTWVPVYVLHYEVRQVVRDFGNQAVKNTDDADLVARMVARLRGLGRVSEAPGGEPRPVVDLRPEDVTWERLSPSALHVAFSYERPVELPFLERRLSRQFDVDFTLDTTAAGWDAPR